MTCSSKGWGLLFSISLYDFTHGDAYLEHGYLLYLVYGLLVNTVTHGPIKYSRHLGQVSEQLPKSRIYINTWLKKHVRDVYY
jgi:hypothetical protein